MMGEVTDAREIKNTFIVPAIKSSGHYDCSRAKIYCSLTWLVAKAFGTDSVPADLKEPFYTDQYEQEHLKPAVVSLLLSAELYCRAGSLILTSGGHDAVTQPLVGHDAVSQPLVGHDAVTQPLVGHDAVTQPLVGHDAVIQALAQKGLHVTDQTRLVTERDLRKRPLQMSAHLAMMDTLMMAYTVETVSAEKVVACILRYSSHHDEDADTPYDTEDAVTSWINKVNEYLKDIIGQERRRERKRAELVGRPGTRSRKEQQTVAQQVPWIPPVDNLLKDTVDGCALAALLHFYCPQLIRLEDICLKECMSLADSLYNLQLVQDFCQEHLNRCCHFSLEDMVYVSSSLKNNYLVFLAELFCWFEEVKPSFVQPRVLDTEEPALTSLRNIPSVPISNVTKKSFMERQPSPEPPSLPLRPQPRNSGEMKRSTSMSFVDVGTWPKEKRSGPYGVSFDIPFDKEDTQTSTPPGHAMTRSTSTEGFKVHQMPRGMKRILSFQPINGQGVGIEEEGCPDSLAGPDLPRQPGRPQPNGSSALDGHGKGAAIPSMEEALQIIHNIGRKPPQCSLTEGINHGFFLHSQNRGRGVVGLHPKAQQENMDLDSLNTTKTTEVDTDIHLRTEDIAEMVDEDSSLGEATSIELDMDTLSPCLSSSSYGKSPSTSSGIKMTSFAEQKFRKLSKPESGRRTSSSSSSGGGSSLKTTPEGSELGLPLSVSWAPTPEHSTVHQQSMPLTQAPPTGPALAPPPSDPVQAMATEMVQLHMCLEEKRKAIETQKKKVEAAFTLHRQRMDHSTFLDVVKRKADCASVGGGEEEMGKMTAEKERKTGRSKVDTPDGAEQGQAPFGVCWLKSPGRSMGEEGGQGPSEVDLANYTRSMEKLNHSLGFLQMEMQRLAQQQEVIMAMREQRHQQAWVIPPPETQPSPQKYRASVRSSDSPSPTDSPRSPTSIKRKSASFHSRNPRTPRPSELKLAPYNRCLTAPQSVDSLPRLRRFSPCQAMAFTYMGDKPIGETPEIGDTEHVLSPEREAVSASSPSSPAKNNQRTQQGTLEISRDDAEEKEMEEEKHKYKMEEIKPIIVSTVSEVLAQPVKESFTVTPTETPLISDMFGQARSNLIEVPLYVLKPLEGEGMEESEGMQGTYGDNEKMSCGFFFKGDGNGEDNMAQKRAALLEKRLKRDKETQKKKLQQEAELERKKEESRVKAEEEHARKEDEKSRRELIKQEYLRRKQLKLMEDMDTVMKPQRPPGAKHRRARPRSIHRDSMDSSRSPARAAVPSLSLASLNLGDSLSLASLNLGDSLSLASLNLGDSDTVQSEKRTPRPDSADGFLSPCRSGSRTGEDDWENGSTASSVKSNTEYTGPKLYKEPSAKSNKHIIQNALAHCCLAGKVNEGQKNKIVEEMEKSEANNFLVLFRDGGCQFRSLYVYSPETDEATKLTGIGPKSIMSKMIEGLYKYNSDRKQFSQIPAKTMSASVDAITIHGHLWQTRKPATPKKVLPAKS
ncbi:calmodulin-regulated spectrin-associated protein 2-like [Oncorhynchus tshawytscha]|uniref:Calmodulin-regulated spectrin-associated protein 2-like n=1 Tax=Oncorhynchus tshawytscha TaxID=74940 RepID=A0A8C8EI23_ONCTS|nr:calmodulin-regulated spectrin-associated protein 2-like [Oncorhynchus tshawytscha]